MARRAQRRGSSRSSSTPGVGRARIRARPGLQAERNLEWPSGKRRRDETAAGVKILFAHPADVAYADQAAASLTGVTVALRGLVPLGRMYVIAGDQAPAIRYASELERLAEQIVDVEPRGRPGSGERR
jgi:hypothetical protein